jgi:branched-chain amino acid aminotransferase
MLSFDEVIDRLIRQKAPYSANYLAMYSSWYNGIIRDPALMMVPIDDHLVHRGDGIFEAIRCSDGKVYDLEQHLDRLERSAKVISLLLPVHRSQLVEAILATIRAANAPDCLIRLFISRGPGGFTTNPYECVASQLYIVVTEFHEPPPEKYEKGVTLKSSHIPIKESYFANVKSCNYLPNVLMKKEAEDAGVDFTVSIDEKGLLGEGSTENIGIITEQGEFLVPRFERILRGTTLARVMGLAQALVSEGKLARVGEGEITPEQAYGAPEVMMFGTTFGVLPVVNYDGRTIGEGKPGRYFKQFLDILVEDMKSGEGMLTPVWE